MSRMPLHDVTIDEARRKGVAWADGCAANQPSGAAGAWPSEPGSARMMLASLYSCVSDEAVRACCAAAAERWTVLVADASARRLAAASEHASRILQRLADAAEHVASRHVGVDVSQVLVMVTSGSSDMRGQAVGWTAEDPNMLKPGAIGNTPGFPSPYSYETPMHAMADGWNMLAPPCEKIVQEVIGWSPGRTEWTWWFTRTPQ